MSIPDNLMMDYFELLSDIPDEELAGFRKDIENNSVNPMVLKKRLACEIAEQFHGQKAAQDAENHFEKTVQKRELHEVHITDSIAIKDNVEVILHRDMPKWLLINNFASSVGEAKRLLAQGAVSIIHTDGTRYVVRDNEAQIKPGDIVKVGKRRFKKITSSDTKP